MHTKLIFIFFAFFSSLTCANALEPIEDNIDIVESRQIKGDVVVLADAKLIKISATNPEFTFSGALFKNHEENCGPWSHCYLYELSIKNILYGKIESKVATVAISQNARYERKYLKNWLLVMKKIDAQNVKDYSVTSYRAIESSFLMNDSYCFTSEVRGLGKSELKKFIDNSYYCYSKASLVGEPITSRSSIAPSVLDSF